MVVLEIEGVYYDVREGGPGEWFLIKFQDREPVENVAMFHSRSQAGEFEKYLSDVASIVERLDVEVGDDAGVLH